MKAKLYATLGMLRWDVTEEIIRDNPEFKKHMTSQIVNYYDDDLKIFMCSALRRVDYLKHCS